MEIKEKAQRNVYIEDKVTQLFQDILEEAAKEIKENRDITTISVISDILEYVTDVLKGRDIDNICQLESDYSDNGLVTLFELASMNK